MHLQLTIDAYSLFLYLEHTTIFMLVMFFCCIYLSHFKGQTLKLLSDFKPVHGPKKVGDRWAILHKCHVKLWCVRNDVDLSC